MSLPPFEQVVLDHSQVVLHVCRALVGPHDAEDAWSETFLAALTAYPRLRDDSYIRGWLVTIAHRKAIDRLRAAQRAPIPIGTLPNDPSLDRSAPDRSLDLWHSIAELPVAQRSAVVYHYIADLPYAQVAKMLDRNEPAVRRAAADGIAKLRTTIRREDIP